MARKQSEITSLHELVAQWAMKYMELERSKEGAGKDAAAKKYHR